MQYKIKKNILKIIYINKIIIKLFRKKNKINIIIFRRINNTKALISL